MIDPPAEDNCSPKADPLAGLQAPASASGPCMPDNEFVDYTSPLDPGVYCGGLKIDGNSDLVLNPGVYTIKNGQLFIGSNSRVTGTGVAFYLTGDSSTLIFFDSNAVIDLKAPQRGISQRPHLNLLVAGERELLGIEEQHATRDLVRRETLT